jgi:hypothetical protein
MNVNSHWHNDSITLLLLGWKRKSHNQILFMDEKNSVLVFIIVYYAQ